MEQEVKKKLPKIRSSFESLPTDGLLEMLNPDYNIGKTFFDEPNKKFMISHNYKLIAEVNCDEDDVDDYETFGYPLELIHQAKINPVFGPTPRECLIKFLSTYPSFIVYEEPLIKGDGNTE